MQLMIDYDNWAAAYKKSAYILLLWECPVLRHLFD